MSKQQTRAVSTAWKKLGLGWALGATLVLGCGSDGLMGTGGPSLATSAQHLDYGGHEYVFVLTPKTWADAELACLNMGKHLVTLETAAEADWLQPQQPAGAGIWLGINDRAVEGSWVWSDGTSSYTRWAVGEPNNANNEDCAVSYTNTGLWNDVPCTTTAAFVCESFDAPNPKAYNGHTYTIFQDRKLWVDAQRSCSELGQSLVTINDAAEEAWLKQHFGSATFWTGYNDVAKEGTFVWPEPSSYVNWRTGEPNNTSGNEDCTVANAPANGSAVAGRWNDIPCNSFVNFMCEDLSAGPVYYQYVDFTAADTNTAMRNTTDVTLNLEPGQVLDVGTCGVPGAYSTNDTYLRLLDATGLEVMDNDDACKGSGSRIRYRVPPCGGGTYILRAGCYDTGSCGGRIGYTY